MQIKEPKEPLPEKCWEQLKGEPIEAYNQFLVYLKIDKDERTLKAYNKLVSPKAKYVSGHINELASKYYWTYRATKYDNSLNLKALAKIEEEYVTTKKDWDGSLDSLRKKIMNFVNLPDKSAEDGINKAAIVLGKDSKMCEFLLGAHKALFGDKHSIEATIVPKVTLKLEEL